MTSVGNFIADLLRGGMRIKEAKRLAGMSFEDK
jgi:hypothetical protein